jgi:hypothetical protein
MALGATSSGGLAALAIKRGVDKGKQKGKSPAPESKKPHFNL